MVAPTNCFGNYVILMKTNTTNIFTYLSKMILWKNNTEKI